MILKMRTESLPLEEIRRVLVVGEECFLPALPDGVEIRACRTYEEARTEIFRVQAGIDDPYDVAFIELFLPDGFGPDLARVFENAMRGRAITTPLDQARAG